MNLGSQLDDLSKLSPKELLLLNAASLKELKHRKIVRTNNSPLGDYAEQLVVNAYGMVIAPNSEKSFDALSNNNSKIQIKARRVLEHKAGERQLSAIRSFTFDFLVGVLFSDDYEIFRAAKIPTDVVRELCYYTKHTNSYIFYLHDSVWEDERVLDITSDLQHASDTFNLKNDEISNV